MPEPNPTPIAEAPLVTDPERLPASQLPGLHEPDLLPLLGARADITSPTVTTELITLCHAHPLVLRELIPTLTDDQLRGEAPLPLQAPLGARSLHLLRQSWAALPARTRDWLLVLALGTTDLAVSVRAARRLGLDLADLIPAENNGVVRVPDTDAVGWSSLLVRAAVIQSATLADRTKTYRALAEATTPQTHPVDHARWLARSLPETNIDPDTMHEAIVSLARGGDLLEACDLANRAATCTVNTEFHLRFRVIAAELCWLAGYGEHALRQLDQIAAVLPDGETRISASVLRWVIRGLRYSWEEPQSNQALAGVFEHSCGMAQRARTLITALLAGWETAPRQALAETIAHLDTAFRNTPRPMPAAATGLAKVIAGRSDPDPEERAALQALSWRVHHDDPLHPKMWPPPILPVFIGEEDAYAQQFTALLDTDHLRAARSTRALLLLKLATAQAAIGHWPHALRNSADSMTLAHQLGLRALHSDALSLSAWLAAAQGDEDTFRHRRADVCQQEGRRASGRQPPMLQWAQGLLWLSLGRPTEAYEHLLPLHTVAVMSPHHLVLRRLSTVDFVDAAVQSRRTANATTSVEEFAAWTASGAAAWAHLDLARCRALLADTDADTERWYLQALALTPQIGRLATTARAELSFGTWLRRHKRHREARAHLRLAEQYFERLTASSWRDRAHAELRAAGEADLRDTSQTDCLTPQELRIARLAAQGKSNRDIADALTLSPRTVSYHLYKIFPKLDITSRTQLPTALASHSSAVLPHTPAS